MIKIGWEERVVNIEQILNKFSPISLEEMKSVRLMNRTDTKFVTSRHKLADLLSLAAGEYYVQEIDRRRIADYYTVYFDTPLYDMFRMHQYGHANRQKLRIRSYVESKKSFLEVKTKDNHKKTNKKRVPMPDFAPENPRHDILFGGVEKQLTQCDNFVKEHLRYDAMTLSERLENHFHRITLVNKDLTERLTIDFDLRFHNLVTGNDTFFDNVVIIELKRDGLKPSPVLNMLKQLRIKKSGFSKYCVGTAITAPTLPQNRIKRQLRNIRKIENQKSL